MKKKHFGREIYRLQIFRVLIETDDDDVNAPKRVSFFCLHINLLQMYLLCTLYS